MVRALYGLHPVRHQEGPLVFYLMGVPGLWSVPYQACALCAVKKGPLPYSIFLTIFQYLMGVTGLLPVVRALHGL